ncbi:MAG: DUF3795 domain-containing protein [Dehalococcoidia bacterium]|nr:MAG: DUF3795 domain-containing protein [Dehalococcoidia bacterium]
MEEELIAPCGMNCGICSGYLAWYHDVKNKGIKMPYCKGCRSRDKQCAFLKKRCKLLLNKEVKYCFECSDFPCKNLNHIDKRYRTHYKMSMIENLKLIRDKGVNQLLISEKKNWKCPNCSGVICCHNGICFNCSLELLRQKIQKYRWENN